MIITHFFLIICLLISFSVMAQGPSLININYDQEETSDHLILRHSKINYINHARDLSWPYQNEGQQTWDYGFGHNYYNGDSGEGTLQGHRINGVVGHNKSKSLYAKFSPGIHTLKNTVIKKHRSMFIFELEAETKIEDKFYGKLTISRDYLYSDAILPAGLTSFLRSYKISTNAVYHWQQKVKTVLRGSYQILSDKNRRQDIDLSLMYGISPYNPWIWVGFGATLLKNSLNRSGYWTPKSVSTIGPRAELSIPIYRPFSVGMSTGPYRYYSKEERLWGSGHYSTLKIAYGHRNAFEVALSAIRIDSLKDGKGNWSSTKGLLQASWCH